MAVIRAREERHDVVLRARMQIDGPPVNVCIRNISLHGMMLEAPEPPRKGEYVELFGTVTAVGRVVWTDRNRFGIRTRDCVNLSLLLGIEQPKPTPKCPGEKREARLPARPATAEESRLVGRAIDFALVSAAVAALVALVGYLVFGLISQPFDSVAQLL